MSTPFALPLNTVLDHLGRKIRYNGCLGDNLLSFTDVRSAGPVKVIDPVTGEEGTPTFEWFAVEYAAGRLKRQNPVVVTRSGRVREVARLDIVASTARDKRSAWRMMWAMAASQAGLPKTDAAYREFIRSKCDVIVSQDNFPPPSPSNLRCHVRKLETVGASTSVFVSMAGRQRGQSQLPAVEDSLVHDIALRYWAAPHWSILDAHAVMQKEWDDMVNAGVAGLSDKLPSYETLRLRVRHLETYETVKAKRGQEAAERQFGASGEPVPTTHPFERVFLDGTELRQIATFGGNLNIAGSKMKLVYLYDDFSEFVTPPVTFPGPYREEMSIEAIIRMMTPPTELTEDMLEEEPWAWWAFGTPLTIVPDNDKTLIPPGYIPALTELGPEIELPKTYHSNAKSDIEGFHGWIKGRLSELHGTVRGRTQHKEVKYDPVAEAEMSVHQFRHIVARLFWEHNTAPRDSLGGRSPLQVVKAFMLAKGGPVIDDPGHVRRMLSKSHPNKLLTKNGLVFDSILYRSDEVEDLLCDNLHGTAMGDRLEGTAKCYGELRTFEGDIDKVEFFNELRQTYVPLYSTQPTYTAGLSRWEHNEYRRLARIRNEKFQTEEQRRRSRAKSLELIETEAPKLPFKQRAKLAALRDCEQIRVMSGQRATDGMPKCPEASPHVKGTSLGHLRRAPSLPPPGTRKYEEAKNTVGLVRSDAEWQPKIGTATMGSDDVNMPRNWDELGDDLDDDADYR